jgi:hypothetical protein
MLKTRIITSAYQLVADLIGEYLDDCNEGDIHRVEADGLEA